MAPGGISLVKTKATKMPARLAMPTTERSIPPVIIASMTPSVRMPSSGNWLAIESTLSDGEEPARVEQRHGHEDRRRR